MSTGDASPFTVVARAGTDVWKKPPSTNIFNAPVARTVTGPLSKFRSARVTFWADWKERYDQGGILLVPRRRSSGAPSPESPPDRWVKTGVELYQGVPQLSTVATDRWADWSVGKLESEASGGDGGRSVTVEIVREGDEHGSSAWVYHHHTDDGTGKAKTPLREICWLFADPGGEPGSPDELILEVSALAARPEKGTAADLEVRFSEFVVKWDG